MGQLVTEGAMLQCMFGAAPATLNVVPSGAIVTAGPVAATIMACAPMVNIATFGTCNSPTNPATKNPSATAPCVPATTPWAPGAPAVLINGVPALTSDSRCTCTLGGPECISITTPGQTIVEISG